MRRHLVIAAIGALTLSSTAALADWHNPTIYREANGDWLKFEYNDGQCYHTFERSGTSQHAYSSGDCTHVMFQSDQATPLYAAPAPDDDE